MMSEVNYPLTPLQKGMLFQYLSAPEDGVYIMQAVCTLREKIDIERMRAAWMIAIDYFPVLRTQFQIRGTAEPIQSIQDSVTLPFDVHDWRSRSEKQHSSDLLEYIESDLRQEFDLTAAPLLRVALVITGNEECTLIFTNHHMIIDGMSRQILLEKVFKIYDADLKVDTLFKSEKYSFFDYVGQSTQSVPESSQSFWQELLESFVSPIGLSTTLPAPEYHKSDYRYGHHSELLTESVTAKLREIATQNNANLNTLVQLAWGILLSRYSGESDVVFGVTLAGRSLFYPEDKDIVGLFINTLPIRIQFTNGVFFLDLLAKLRVQQLAIREHETTPLIEIQQCVPIPKGAALFDSVVVFNPTSPTDSLKDAGFDGDRRSLEVFGFTQFPATLEVFAGQKLELRVSGDRTIMDDAAILGLVEHLGIILRGIAEDPQRAITDIPVISESECRRLLVEWNDNNILYQERVPVHQMFEKQAAENPDKPAITWGEITLDYQELNRRANLLACELIAHGVVPDEPVAICMSRSIEMPVAVLGVLKAGGAYVPLDPNYPAERLEYMLVNSGARVVLTNTGVPNIPDYMGAELELDKIDWQNTEIETANPGVDVSADNLVYMIYTSGSTGKPKGVEMRHGALENLIRWQLQQDRFSGPMKCLQFTSLSFDVSFQELFSTWASGGCLIMVSEETRRDPRALVSFIAENKVERLYLPFIALQGLAEVSIDRADLKFSLKDVVTAGEQLIVTDALRAFFSRLESGKLHNQYGPSETHVVTALTLSGTPQDWPKLPAIGRPITNCSIFLLDSNLNPVPTGVAGELYIGGDCLARGYHNQPELTEERFIWNPFAEKIGGKRLYRSGDLARYHPGNNIEFLGRADDQVKIRGFRVELGEIEAVLERHVAIGKCAVIMREDQPGNKRLVAYIVPPERENEIAGEREGAFSVGEVRDSLRSQLPEYMVPAAFVVLDSLPLTPSGKLNRRALPEPRHTQINTQGSIVKPRDSTEEQLVQIWESVLGVSPIGITQNFFDLGGHSLLAVQLMVRIEEVFETSLDLNTLWFEATTIETLAPLVRGEDIEKKYSYLVRIKPEGSRTPLFVVHTIGGGNLFHYNAIIQWIHPEQPVYGLQASGIGDGLSAHTKVEEMAAHCIKVMREVKPEGPFLICGYSSGGVVAYEMALQLRESGYDNLMLFMIDAINPRLTDTLKDYLRFVRLNIKLKRYRLIQERTYYFVLSRLGLEKFRDLKILGESHRWAQWSYVPKPYTGSVVLFESTGSKKLYGDTHLGWKKLVQGTLDVILISSSHGLVVKDEQAGQVASVMQEYLDRFNEQCD
jgi:amino acid adenylation domain-containing protein